MGDEAVGVEATKTNGVQSPPKVTVVETPAADPRRELEKLAGEVAKKGSRKLLWDYLRLRSKVMGR